MIEGGWVSVVGFYTDSIYYLRVLAYLEEKVDAPSADSFSWIPASVPPGLRRNDRRAGAQIINGMRIRTVNGYHYT